MMGSMSGILQRPLLAAAAVAAASVSTDLPNKLTQSTSSETVNSESHNSDPSSKSSRVSHISVSKLARLTFVASSRVPVPNINYYPLPSSSATSFGNSIASSPVLVNLYHSAKLAQASKPSSYSYSSQTVPSDDLYRWHLPELAAIDVAGKSECSYSKSRTVVVLLGWLGSKQKHLSKYAEWYTSRGFHAITFTFPMSEVLSYQVGGKAEQDVEFLVNHLADWLEEEHGKNLVFHTFSNTGWLTYGVILEKFQKRDSSLLGSIRGCVVDSAPVAVPNPKVWASGFSAALLKKQSIATKASRTSLESSEEVKGIKPAAIETALLAVLEKFFEVLLNLPPVDRRLSDVIGLLSSGQPECPQLYIYSSADRVIPADSVESFIEEQRRSEHKVKSCNFISTPHVDHFRNDPQLYTNQLTQFLEDSVLSCCKASSLKGTDD